MKGKSEDNVVDLAWYRDRDIFPGIGSVEWKGGTCEICKARDSTLEWNFASNATREWCYRSPPWLQVAEDLRVLATCDECEFATRVHPDHTNWHLLPADPMMRVLPQHMGTTSLRDRGEPTVLQPLTPSPGRVDDTN